MICMCFPLWICKKRHWFSGRWFWKEKLVFFYHFSIILCFGALLKVKLHLFFCRNLNYTKNTSFTGQTIQMSWSKQEFVTLSGSLYLVIFDFLFSYFCSSCVLLLYCFTAARNINASPPDLQNQIAWIQAEKATPLLSHTLPFCWFFKSLDRWTNIT